MNIDDIKAAAEWWAAHGNEDHVGIDAVRRFDYVASLLADAFVSHPFGVLKPLEWGCYDGVWRASSAHETYRVWETERGIHWSVWPHNYSKPSQTGRDDSIDHGKQLCEQHYAAEMAKAFTKIGGGPCGE